MGHTPRRSDDHGVGVGVDVGVAARTNGADSQLRDHNCTPSAVCVQRDGLGLVWDAGRRLVVRDTCPVTGNGGAGTSLRGDGSSPQRNSCHHHHHHLAAAVGVGQTQRLGCTQGA